MPVIPIREGLSYSAGDAPVAARLQRVSRLYGKFVALREVSLAIPAGSSVVLLGGNGAGKSTVLKLVAGLTAPSYGRVTVFGETPRSQRGRIGTMGHATMLYDELTAMENLTYFAQLGGLAETRSEQEAIAAGALQEIGLNPALTRRLSEFSQGMRQRASLARVLMAKPRLLLLDEPFSNLDMASAHGMVDRLMEYLSETGADGTSRTLLLTTHQADLARPLAKTTLTLSGGQIASIAGDNSVVALP